MLTGSWNWHGNRTGSHLYCSPENDNGGGGSGGGGGSQGGDGKKPPEKNGDSSSDGTKNTEHMIPKSRFDEVNNELKTLREQHEQQQRDHDAAEQQRLQDEGKWKELAEKAGIELAKVKPFQERASNLEKLIAESNTRRIEQIPEAMRSLVPEGAPEVVAAYLDKNWSLLTAKPAPDLDGGAGADNSTPPKPLTAEEKHAAAASGMTDQQWREAQKKAAQTG